MHDLSNRHGSTQQIAQWFSFEHLKAPLKEVSQQCHDLADQMIEQLDDSPELTAGLRKLLEAKDCFVRAAIDSA
jgi:glutamate/tyrosine decarboxylase-like PLP-dependent enzyme